MADEKKVPELLEKEGLVSENPMIEESGEILNARDSVSIMYPNSCGRGGRSAVLVHNNSAGRRIGVTIEISYYYQGRPRRQSLIYNISPGQRINLGCTVPGPTQQRFNYSIAGAWYN